MLAIFLESVHGHDGEVRVVLGIGGKVEVYHLLGDFVAGEGSPAHLGEHRGGVHAEGHVGDDLLDHVTALLAILVVDGLIEETTWQKMYVLSSFISPFLRSSKYWPGGSRMGERSAVLLI